ncbi:metallophosphoesterase family protein [Pseudonocardia sp. GCM10023141]|uniref:metallophosphoesterase family protein n=1 Tax=Pseudonocardia sp. GCM10023141 TaxID=3252653 RepID=UPI003609500F
MSSPRLLAVSDLHVRYPENRAITEGLRPTSDGDWLIVAGDVAEQVADVAWALELLRDRFATVIWVPGNHELWTRKKDPVALRGVARYEHLVALCRELGVLTPEDPFPVWHGDGGPATVAPLFVLYDYTFRPAGTSTYDEAIAAAYAAGVVATDEALLAPDPYPGRAEWCHARVELSAQRLAACDPDIPTVLVNHWPLTRTPTRVLTYPEFALWCGTERTADWHVRYRAKVVVYGHLHIPRVIHEDGVRFVEASLGYPREWKKRDLRFGTTVTDLLPRQVLPVPPAPDGPPVPGDPR